MYLQTARLSRSAYGPILSNGSGRSSLVAADASGCSSAAGRPAWRRGQARRRPAAARRAPAAARSASSSATTDGSRRRTRQVRGRRRAASDAGWRASAARSPRSRCGSLGALASLPGVQWRQPRPARPRHAGANRAPRSAPRWVAENLGVDGAGVGVAIIDSGVRAWHDDLGGNRVVHFVDFVNFQPLPYDDYGHGTHVAGIIAGNGYDSGGARRGIAPGAHLVVLKVLDGDGDGLHQQRHRRDRLRDRAARGVQHPRHQPVGRGRRVRVVQDRPADARGATRGRSGHRRRHGRGQPRAQRQGTAAVRRHHGARQRAVGAHRRRLEPQRHGRSRGRHGRRRSARAARAPSTQGRSRISSRRASASSRWPMPAARCSRRKPDGAALGHGADRDAAVPEPERHEHGGAGRQRHDRADAAGEPGADAEAREGDPAVHGGDARRLRRGDAGRRLPERARRRSRSRAARSASPARSRPVHIDGSRRKTTEATAGVARGDWSVRWQRLGCADEDHDLSRRRAAASTDEAGVVVASDGSAGRHGRLGDDRAIGRHAGGRAAPRKKTTKNMTSRAPWDIFSMKKPAAPRAALRLRGHRCSERACSSCSFPWRRFDAVALPAAARALVDHLGLQGEPAARARAARRCRSRTRSTSRRCCCSGRTRRCSWRRRAPTASARSASRSGIPLYRTLFSMACLVVTVQAAGAVYALARRRARRPSSWPLAIAAAARRRGDDLLPHQHADDRDGDRAVDAAVDRQGLERELPLERAELLRRRRRRGARRLDRCSAYAQLAGAAAGGRRRST